MAGGDMIKSRIILLLVILMVVCFSGCSSSDKNNDDATANLQEYQDNQPSNPLEISCGTESICGAVFIDTDKDSLFSTTDSPIAGVQVTNGKNISVTDDKGIFELPKGMDYVYLTKPAGYDLPLISNSIPAFFKKTEAQKQLYYFYLTPSAAKDTFSSVIMNDIHLEVIKGQGEHGANQEPLATFNEFIDEIMSIDPRPDFIIANGDQSGVTPDDISGLEDYVAACSKLGIPVYNSMGNPGHNDSDLDRVFFKDAYRSYFGPLYYAFDYGDVHYVVLDTNLISGDHGRTLEYGLDETQMAWLEADLELNKSKRILIFCHEPVDNTENGLEYIIKIIMNKPPDVWVDKESLLELFSIYKAAAVFAGHTHSNGLYEDGSTVFVTNGAISGAWWGPSFNKVMDVLYPGLSKTGINANPDGTPQGYRLLSASPDVISTSYKAFKEQRNICFADPAGTKIGSGKLSYLDIDTSNSYTFCLKGKPGNLTSGALPLKPLSGIIPFTMNAYSIYPVRKVEYKIDSGNWADAEHKGGLIWQTQIDASQLKSGLHRISARIIDDKSEFESRLNIITGER
jgi:hypothetical protein